jgi:DNA primase large subunit
MQIATARFGTNDLAKYPFLKEAAERVKRLDLSIHDLVNPEYAQILVRAQERVEEAILYAKVSRCLRNPDIEILSFPTAMMLAASTQNSFISKRYALAEAKQTYEDLRREQKDRIEKIARDFGWQLETNTDGGIPYAYKLRFVDYLKNITQLRDAKWKLTNRLLSEGKVYLALPETARLLSEEVRRSIEGRLETRALPKLPQEVLVITERLKSLSIEKIGKTEIEGFPQTIVQKAFPPCITSLYEQASKGHHLSHIGRFTLTSFLVTIGMPSEAVTELFKTFSDYNERLTRYQVEHIAGERGSKTRYTPPMCDTLKTHGVCASPDGICQRTRHPTGYYRIKAKQQLSKATGEE